jgi:amino acid transporter
MRDAVAQSLGFVVPVMGVAYLTPLVAGGAGAATPLAMLLGGIGVLCIGLVIAQFARQYPHAGSMYEYVSRTAGPFPGFIVGWIYFVGAFFLTVAILPGVGAFIQGTLASHNWTVPWLPFAIGLLILSSIVQYIDVRVATRVVLWIVFVSAGVILVFAIYVIIRGGADGNSLKFFMPSSATTGLSGVWFGLIFAFLMYSGFEASAVLSEETKDARRVIAITVLAAVGIIIGYFVVVVYAEAISYGLKDANEVWPTDPTPLFTMGAKYGGTWLVDVLSVAAIVDAIAGAVAVSVTATRMLYALGRDGLLPRWLGKTHAKHKTPHNAIFFMAFCGLVYILFTYFYGWDAIVGFGFGGGTGGLALIIVYLVMSIAGFTLKWNGIWPARIIIPIIGIVLTAYAFKGSVYPVPPSPSKWMPYTLLAFVVVGLIFGLVARSRREPAILSIKGQVQPDIE